MTFHQMAMGNLSSSLHYSSCLLLWLHERYEPGHPFFSETALSHLNSLRNSRFETGQSPQYPYLLLLIPLHYQIHCHWTVGCQAAHHFHFWRIRLSRWHHCSWVLCLRCSHFLTRCTCSWVQCSCSEVGGGRELPGTVPYGDCTLQSQRRTSWSSWGRKRWWSPPAVSLVCCWSHHTTLLATDHHFLLDENKVGMSMRYKHEFFPLCIHIIDVELLTRRTFNLVQAAPGEQAII